jgi:hypothetical protein
MRARKTPPAGPAGFCSVVGVGLSLPNQSSNNHAGIPFQNILRDIGNGSVVDDGPPTVVLEIKNGFSTDDPGWMAQESFADTSRHFRRLFHSIAHSCESRNCTSMNRKKRTMLQRARQYLVRR